MGRDSRTATHRGLHGNVYGDIPADMRHAAQTYADPFVSRQQAEAAAAQAYYQAYHHEPLTKPPRRKGNRGGKSEGSHFEDARLGRRRSTTGGEYSLKPRDQTIPIRFGRPLHSFAEDRRNAPSSSSSRAATAETGRLLRKCKSAYTEGSPTPRKTRAIVEPNQSAPGMPLETTLCSAEVPRTNRDSLDSHSLFAQTTRTIRPSMSQQLALKKSFLFAPFRKVRPNDDRPKDTPRFDNRSLPPFNHANDPSAYRLAMASSDYADQPEEQEQQAKEQPVLNRKTSDVFRARWKQTFTRRGKVPIEMPAQHVEATKQRWNSDPIARPSTSHNNISDLALLQRSAAMDVNRSLGHSSRSSDRLTSTIRSRVTSWTNTTINEADECRSNDDSKKIPRPESMARLRKKASFFGKPIVNKLRKSSNQKAAYSSEAQDLFSALQNKISQQLGRVNGQSKDPFSPLPPPVPIISVQDPIPSKVDMPRLDGGLNTPVALSIRSVTGNNVDQDSDIQAMDKGTFEPLNQDSELQCQNNAANDDYHEHMTHIQKRWASHFVRPVNLQSTQLSSNAMDRADVHLNYSQNMLDDHDARAVLSPSLYSRGTDDSPVINSSPPDHLSGTKIRVTNREVRRYSVSPIKPSGGDSFKSTRDWRSWLSGEWHDRAADTNLGASLHLPVSEAISVEPHKTDAHVDDISNSDSVSAELGTTQPRPLLTGKQRKSSFMNERYPMLDSSRDAKADRATPDLKPESKRYNDVAIDDGLVTAPIRPQKGISSANFPHALQSARSTVKLRQAPSVACMRVSDASFKDENWPLQARPKSAFNLRANYRTRLKAEAKPVEIHRRNGRENDRPVLDMQTEDDTISAITAGPYASTPFSLSEIQRRTPATRDETRIGSACSARGSVMLRDGPTIPVYDSIYSSKTRQSSKWLTSSSATPTNHSSSARTSIKTPYSGSTKDSPAQKMASTFLEVRARERSPAFV